MLTASPTQFKLLDDGQIYYQEQESNPLPGRAIARLGKGPSALQPLIVITDTELLSGNDKAPVRDHLAGWLKNHIKNILEPLVDLADSEQAAAPVRGIAFQIHEAMGIVPREQLADLIADLDQPMRQDLRSRKIRLGPVLVFIPALNKPAAVRLRAILWSLFNDKPLPAETPKDGIVSFKVEPHKIDKSFYQAVGYPVYGSRAIRIDMLDRVINAVYEGAKDGKFQAQHEMAEWLGCGIEELYEILEAMGHRKIRETPQAEKPAEESADATAETLAPAEGEAAKTAKPTLATFRLKKGKAFEKPKERQKPIKNEKPRGKKKPEKDSGPRVISAVPKSAPADSPFAILEQLKSRAK